MIRLARQSMETIDDLYTALQKAIQIEMSTLPPYLYAMFSIMDDTNVAAISRLQSVVHEEMTHMALACNILNALGGSPVIAQEAVVPTYPGPLPYDIGADGSEPFQISLLPFCPQAMAQGSHIEEPEDPLLFHNELALLAEPTFETIGQFYRNLDSRLEQLSPDQWNAVPHKQIGDHPFFAGQLFPVTDYPSASKAISHIVSEGEGNTQSPLDFEGDVAHYYRFEEIRRNQVLKKSADAQEGFVWGESLGVDWTAVHPAIADPGQHDFSGDLKAQAAQDECDFAFTDMLQEIERAVNGEPGRLGNAVRAMFDLRMAARAAFTIPLAGRDQAAGPSFRIRIRS